MYICIYVWIIVKKGGNWKVGGGDSSSIVHISVNVREAGGGILFFFFFAIGTSRFRKCISG